ncbi:MAG: DUF4445 domain-containing protein [Desulfuromonadales bacterium]|nr:DUF4445 domain-containing protein [Desulfuromonadales bacterium]
MNNLRLALDLGTTTLGGRLLAADGKVLAEAQLANPQAALGADVIRRLEAALGGEGERLQQLLVQGIELLLAQLLRQSGDRREEIGAAAAAANPAITYLLRRLSPAEILFPPHRPKNGQGGVVDPVDLGLRLPVPLYLFPLVSGYVGGDLVAFLYGYAEEASSLVPASSSRFFIDIGTNGEMALYAGGRWWTTSVAAGPAFEAGGIAAGMPATAGAVEAVELDGDRLRLRTIGGGRPHGICGSGVASAMAAALQAGLIDRRGSLAAPGEVATNLARHLVESTHGRELRLYRDAGLDLRLSQEDIRQFQLAKGAVHAGAACLLQRGGVEAAEVEKVVVTGAFGLSLPPDILKKVAMLPAGMIDKVSFVPGGALAGIGRLLREADGPAQVEKLTATLHPYPLSGTPAFEKAFLSSLDF